MSEEAKGLLGTLRAPEGEVLRLTLRPPEAEGPGGPAFRHGHGEGADQVVQHAGRQVLRIDLPVRKGFDGSAVEVVDGALVVVRPEEPPEPPTGPLTGHGDARGTVLRPSGPRIAALRHPRVEDGPPTPGARPTRPRRGDGALGAGGLLRGAEGDPTAVGREELARRAEERLLEEADRLEGGARDLGIHGGASKTEARAGELGVAALLVREEAEAVGSEGGGPAEGAAEDPPPEARG